MEPIYKKRKIIFICILLLFIFIYYLCWCYLLKFNASPDELMRYLVPKYIYSNGSLPTGYSKDAIYFLGNWSYAFYPQMLGGITSALFMKVFSLWTHSDHLILFAARITSALFGTITVAFVGLTVQKITKRIKIAIFSILFVAFLPQFTYLSSYINNDIIAAAGVSMIMYALVSNEIDHSWNLNKILILSVGSLICILGYLNSMVFVLVSAIYLILTLIKQDKISKKKAINYFIIYCAVIAIFCLPFFIRNFIIYNGDLLGMRSFHNQYAKWLDASGKKLQFPYISNHSIGALFIDNDFLVRTFESFVGFFGYLSVQLKPVFYLFYFILFYTGILGLFIKPRINELKLIKNSIVTLIVGTILLIILFLYYDLYIDYQTQGRYIISALPPLALLETLGLSQISKVMRMGRIIKYSFTLFYVLLNIFILCHYVYPTLVL